MRLEPEHIKSLPIHDRETHFRWITQIYTTAARKLTQWEWEFIDRLDETIRKGHSLSLLQESILEKIYAEKTR